MNAANDHGVATNEAKVIYGETNRTTFLRERPPKDSAMIMILRVINSGSKNWKRSSRQCARAKKGRLLLLLHVVWKCRTPMEGKKDLARAKRSIDHMRSI